MVTREAVVRNAHGLHLRQAAQLVQLASAYACDLFLEKGGERADARSPMEIMGLGAVSGELVRVVAEGQDELAAVEALAALIAALED